MRTTDARESFGLNFFGWFRARMKARRSKIKGLKEFRQAAISYFLIKILIILLVYEYVSCPGCEDTQFIRHAVHLVLFTHFIWAGMRITSSVIAVISAVRGTVYVINFFFKTSYFLYLPVTGTSLALFNEDGAGNFVLLVNAFLMYLAAGMIFRALKAGSETGATEEALALDRSAS